MAEYKKQLHPIDAEKIAFAEAADLTLKSHLFRTLQKALKNQTGTQKEISDQLGIPQPKVSDIVNGRMTGFSVERIANLLLRLNYDIYIEVGPGSSKVGGRIKVG